jgi:hypothetical protein
MTPMSWLMNSASQGRAQFRERDRLHRDVQRRDGLVADDGSGRLESAGNADTLFLAARQLV